MQQSSRRGAAIASAIAGARRPGEIVEGALVVPPRSASFRPSKIPASAASGANARRIAPLPTVYLLLRQAKTFHN
jgi:hypothetical protein